MVMLPLISSVVAPSAAMAASGATVLFNPCSSPSDCGPSAPFCRSLIDGTPLGIAAVSEIMRLEEREPSLVVLIIRPVLLVMLDRHQVVVQEPAPMGLALRVF